MRLISQAATTACLAILSSPVLASPSGYMHGGHHGGGYHGGGHHILGWILCIVVLVLAVIGLVTVGKMLFGKKGEPSLVQPKSEAVRKLEVKFAETDMTEEDFRARLHTLDPKDSRGKPPTES